MSEEKKYEGLKNYLSYKQQEEELWLDESQMQEIIELAIKQDGWESNRGKDWKRLEHNPREQAFHDQWVEDNIPRSGINFGQGILQDLFIERGATHFFAGQWKEIITNRDRMIVATVIQWLGSNVGMCFLEESLRRFGAGIKYPEYKP